MLLSVNKQRGSETLNSLTDSLVHHLFIHNKVSWVASGSHEPGAAPFSRKSRILHLPEISSLVQKKNLHKLINVR